jgi:Fe2+ transport system protein FeoA
MIDATFFSINTPPVYVILSCIDRIEKNFFLIPGYDDVVRRGLMIKLNEIRTGDYVEVLEIPEQCPLRQALEQFGITEGSVLFCRYCSPGAELAALESQGSVVALRLRELSGITVRYYP